MNQLKTFNHNQFGKLEVLILDGKEYFPATDMARKLGYSNPHKAVIDHCKYLTKHEVPHPQSAYKTIKKNFIPESDLYRLIISSKLPKAEEFEKWVFDEVLPTIRKHGAYMTPETIEKALLNPDTIINLATRLKEEQQRRKQLEAKIERDEPYTTFGKVVANSNASISIGSFAKLLYDEHGIKIGRNRLFEWLRNNGYLIKSGREKNQPKQQYVEQGLFETTVTLIKRPSGDIESVTTMITGKGQVEIAKKLLKEFEEAI